MNARAFDSHRPAIGTRSFTLIELLVVIGILALLSVLTAVGYQSVANDAKLSSGKNTVMAVLDNARATAMKKGRIIAAVFRAVPEGADHQRIEASLAEWTGESYVNGSLVIDRFRPVPNTSPRMLARDVQLAAPGYGASNGQGVGGLDYAWFTCSHFPGRINSDGTEIFPGAEAPGAVICIMFAANGTVITRNSQSDSDRMFIDFNNDGRQRQGDSVNFTDYDNSPMLPGPDYPNSTTYCDMGMSSGPSPVTLTQFFCHRFPHDEPYATSAAFLAVFDESAARELYEIADWNDPQERRDDISDYIRRNVTPIHFNRYSGVAMK